MLKLSYNNQFYAISQKGNMVALNGNEMTYASLEDVIGCNKAVVVEGELVHVAISIGKCFGD